MTNTLFTFKNKKKFPEIKRFYKNLLSLAWKNLSSYTQVFIVNAGIEKILYSIRMRESLSLRWVRKRFLRKFSGQCNMVIFLFFYFLSCALDWIVLILVWFKRSLHSAQVSGQNLMTLQVEEAMWIRTGDYGRLLGKWVKGKQKLCFVWSFWDHMERVRTCQLNGHSRSLSFSAIIIVTIIMIVMMIMIVALCCPLSLFGFMKHYYSAYSWQ